jgi:Laminin G domain
VTEINLEFRPEQPNGILLLSGERDDLAGDFMILTLNNGFVEFIFDCGSGKGVIRSSEKVILHQWNTLMIYRYRWEGWIELNEVSLMITLFYQIILLTKLNKDYLKHNKKNPAFDNLSISRNVAFVADLTEFSQE